MKKIHIIGLVMIAVAAFIMMTASQDITNYADFKQAETSNARVKIVGELAKDKDIVYDPSVDADSMTFFLTDDKGETRKVKLLKAKPQDFERAESIVLTGSMKQGTFVADEILMKCPSKYKTEEMAIEQAS